ncbi:hypothetical protein [Chitinophaga sp. MM2321]|uniref:hypothetical protein n=1 Tax=Chitinophaga sp. MM2321 TaxID=3137178 RepID=UPI0032D5A57F
MKHESQSTKEHLEKVFDLFDTYDLSSIKEVLWAIIYNAIASQTTDDMQSSSRAELLTVYKLIDDFIEGIHGIGHELFTRFNHKVPPGM